MRIEPEHFLYIYLQDMHSNPKLCFDLHKGPLPEERCAYAKTGFKSLEKNAALANLKCIENVGFFIVISILLQRCIDKGKHYAMIVYPNFTENDLSIHIDEELYRADRNGTFYTFIPLRPFPADLNTDENRLDSVLHMRVGRIVAHALLPVPPEDKRQLQTEFE